MRSPEWRPERRRGIVRAVYGRPAPISRRLVASALLAGVVGGGILAEPARASETSAAPIPASTGQTLGGLVLPVEARDGDITIRALRGWHWRHDSTQRLIVQGDVLLEIAGWSFEAPRMVLWIDRIPSESGLVTQVAVWIPDATASTSSVGRGTSGRNLLVVGSIRGETVIDTALMTPERPRQLSHVLQRADDRLANYVASLHTQQPPLTNLPTVVPPAAGPPAFVPVPGGSIPQAAASPVRAVNDSQPWLRRPGATVSFSGNHVTVDAGEVESTVLADGNVVIHYRPAARGDALGALRLSAERAVLYISPGTLADAADSLSADDVRGVYLEGAVIAESDREDYVVRGQRMYYDFITDRAIMLDAVLRTYDRERQVPVYARATELRQLASDQWSGKDVRLSASSFAVPTLSIGSSTATIQQVPGKIRPDGTTGEQRILVTGEHNTLEAGGVPFFYWPWFKGYAERMPLKGQATSFENYRGIGIELKWDLPMLLGLDPLEEDDLTLETSGYTKRGPALGLGWSWDRPGEHGRLNMWGIHDDTNVEERLSTGITQQVPETWRGFLQFEDRIALGNDWNLQAQASWISDPTFMSGWRQDEFRNRREFETSLYLSSDKSDTSLSVLADYSLNQFVSNSWLLASQGFALDEFPRASYRKFGKDLWDTVTWNGSISFSRFKAVIPDGTAAANGIGTNVFRGPNVVFNAGDDISAALAQRGIGSNWSTRVTSMHEFTMPLAWGPVQVTPFATAQIQGFIENDDSTAPPTTDDSDFRGLGGIGVHATTSLQRIYNDVRSETLGINRLRILMDPWAKAWISGANFNPMDVPDYDPLVDATSRGGAVQVGVRHRLQTQRGGAGRWYDVDWLTTSLAATFSTSDATRRWYTPRWYDANPLYSSFGNFMDGSFDFRPAEALTFTGEGNWDFDLGRLTRAAVAMNIDHSPRFSTGVGFRYFGVPGDYEAAFPGNVTAAKGQLLTFPARYEISKTYAVAVSPQYNFSEEDFQSVAATLTRRLADFDLAIYIQYDQIRDETTGGIRLANTKF